MSSILDALEKASKERAARRGDAIDSDALGQQAAVEKRLREERERQRRAMRRAWAVLAVVGVLLIGGTAGAWLLLFRGASVNTPSAQETLTVAAIPAAEPPPVAVVSTPAPPEPTVVATTPEPPVATPEPTPAPVIVAQAPAPTPEPSPTSILPRRKTSDGFTNGQVIHPSEVGLEVGGVLELSSGFIALINDKQIRTGQTINNIRVQDIRFGQLMLDLGEGVVVRARF